MQRRGFAFNPDKTETGAGENSDRCLQLSSDGTAAFRTPVYPICFKAKAYAPIETALLVPSRETPTPTRLSGS